jgi:PD-(D/E)XK nuclease superfamily protein
MPKDTTGRGELSELEIATALARAGRRVLRPLSSGLRYDLALDNGDGTICRIQCKTGILRDGFIEFNVASSDGRRPNGVPYVGQIDAFGIYCPQNRRSYFIPIAEVRASSSKGRLRVDPAKNGQLTGISYAARFEIVPSS